MTRLLNELMEEKSYNIFLFLVLISIFIVWYNQNYFLTDEYYYHFLGDKLETYRIEQFITSMHKMSWWSYIISPIILYVSIVLVAFFIQLYLILMDKEIRFVSAFKIAAISKFFLLAGDLVKNVWLSFKEISFLTEKSLLIIPFSLNQILFSEEFSKELLSILGSINIYEILWGIFLYKGIQWYIRDEKGKVSLMAVILVWSTIYLFQFLVLIYLLKING